MTQFLTGLCILIILSLCIMSAFGFWYFVNSNAAERSFLQLVGKVSDGLEMIGKGLYAILVCGAIAILCLGIGFGLRAGAVPTAQSISYMVMAKRMADGIGNGRGGALPGGFSVERAMLPPPGNEKPPSFVLIGESPPAVQRSVPLLSVCDSDESQTH